MGTRYVTAWYGDPVPPYIEQCIETARAVWGDILVLRAFDCPLKGIDLRHQSDYHRLSWCIENPFDVWGDADLIWRKRPTISEGVHTGSYTTRRPLHDCLTAGGDTDTLCTVLQRAFDNPPKISSYTWDLRLWSGVKTKRIPKECYSHPKWHRISKKHNTH